MNFPDLNIIITASFDDEKVVNSLQTQLNGLANKIELKIGKIDIEGLENLQKIKKNIDELEKLEQKIKDLEKAKMNSNSSEKIDKEIAKHKELKKQLNDEIKQQKELLALTKVIYDKEGNIEKVIDVKKDNYTQTKITEEYKGNREELNRKIIETNNEKLRNEMEEFNRWQEKEFKKLQNIREKDLSNLETYLAKVENLSNRLNKLNHSSSQTERNNITDEIKKIEKYTEWYQKSYDKIKNITVNSNAKFNKEINDTLTDLNKTDENTSKSQNKRLEKNISKLLEKEKVLIRISKQQKEANTLSKDIELTSPQGEKIKSLEKQLKTDVTLDNLKKLNIEYTKLIEQFKKGSNIGSESIKKGDRITKDFIKKGIKSSVFYKNLYKGAKIEVVEFDEISKKAIVTINKGGREYKKLTIELKRLENAYEGVNTELIQFYKRNDTIQRKSAMHLGMFEQFKIALQRVPVWMSAMTVFYTITRSIQQGIADLVEIDKEMTNLRKVTEATTQEFKKFAIESNNIGQALGKTTQDVLKATTEFARLGYKLNEAKKLAQQAILYSNVGDIDVGQASQVLISTIKGFGVEVDKEGRNVRKIVDIFNEVGNNFAISSEGIGEALKRSASSLYEAGNTLEQSVAMITSANAVVQNPEAVGTALKTVTMRLRGINEETGETLDLIPQLEQKFNDVGLSLKKNDKTFKSTYEIFDELSKKWSNLSDFQRANLTELIAGKRQGNIVASMLNNWSDAEKSLASALNSTGSAIKENEKYLDSIEARINKFKNAVIGFWQSTIDDSNIKTVISVGTVFVKLGTKISSWFGALTPIIIASSLAFMGFNTKVRSSIMTNQALAVSLKGLSTSFTTLKVSAITSMTMIRGALVSLGAFLSVAIMPIAIITAVTIAFTWLTRAISKGREESRKMKEHQENLVNSYSKNQKELGKLVDRYKELKSLDGKLSTKQQEEYIEVQNRIAEILPITKNEIDELGNAHLKNVDAIKEEIEYVEELKRKYDELEIAKFEKDAGEHFKEIEKLQNKINSLNNDLLNGTNDIAYWGFNYDSKEKQLELEAELIQNDYKLKLKEKESIEFSKGKLDTLLDLSDATQYLNEKDLEYLKTQIDLNKQTLTSTKSMMKLTRELVIQGNEIAKLRQLGDIGELFSTETLLSIVDSGYTDTFTKMIKIFDEGSDEWNEYLYLLSKGNVDVNLLTKVLDILNGKIKDVNNSLSNSTAIELFKDYTDDIEDLSSAYNTLASGQKLSAKEIYELVTNHEELQGALESENGQLTINKEALLKLMKAEEKQFKNKLRQEKEILKIQQDSLVEKLKIYQADIKGIDDVNEATKKLVMSNLAKKHLTNASSVEAFDVYNYELREVKKILDNLESVKGEIDDIDALIKWALDGSGGSGNPSSQKLDKTDAIIREINAQNELNKVREESLRKLIDEAEDQEDYAKAIENTNKLIEIQKDNIDKLNKANSEIHDEANGIRSDYRQFDTSTWFDKNGEATKEYIDLYNKASGETQKVMQEVFNMIQKLKKAYDESAESIKESREEIEDLTKTNVEYLEQMEEAYKDWQEGIKDIADDVIATMKEYYEKQKELVLDAIDDELDALEDAHEKKMDMLDDELDQYEEIINAKKESYQREDEEADYETELTKLQTERQEIVEKINELALVDTIEAKNKIEQLNEDLAKKEEEINRKKSDHLRKLRDQNLDDELEAERDKIEAEKESAEDSYEIEKEKLEDERKLRAWEYDQIINDEKKWKKIKEEILSGHLDNIYKELEAFEIDFTSLNSEMAKELNDAWWEVFQTIQKIRSAEESLNGIKGKPHNPWEIKDVDLKRYVQNKIDWGNGVNREKAHVDNEALRKEYGILESLSFQELLKYIVGFDTGGYTGSWGNMGKLGMLHEKEIVLNKTDTSNLLEALKITDSLVNSINPINTNLIPSQAITNTIHFDEFIRIDSFNNASQTDIKKLVRIGVNELMQQLKPYGFSLK